MKFNVEHEHKKVMKRSLEVLTEFSRGNFKPYVNALDEMLEMPVNIKANVDFLILSAQNKLLNAIEDPDLKMQPVMENALSAYKKVLNNDFDFNEKEALAVSMATENYARLGMGQANYARDILMVAMPDLKTENLIDVAGNFDIAERHISATNGIRAERTAENAQTAWDMHQVIRNTLSWKANPEGGMTVNYDKPMKTSRVPLMKIDNEIELNQEKTPKNQKGRRNKPF